MQDKNRDLDSQDTADGAEAPQGGRRTEHRIWPAVAAVVCLLVVLLGVLLWRRHVESRIAKATAPVEYDQPNSPYIVSPEFVVEKMLEIAAIKETDVVYDLGCGDGRIVVQAAKRYGCRAVGFDIDPDAIKDARENARENGVEHLVTIEQKDIFTLDLSEADVINIYLLPEQVIKLIPQLRQIKEGARVVCHDFRLEGIPHDQMISVTSQGDEREVYLYTAPLGELDEAFRSWSKARRDAK